MDGTDASGKRVYDKVNGMTCHQCRQKTLGKHTTCTCCNSLQVTLYHMHFPLLFSTYMPIYSLPLDRSTHVLLTHFNREKLLIARALASLSSAL